MKNQLTCRVLIFISIRSRALEGLKFSVEVAEWEKVEFWKSNHLTYRYNFKIYGIKCT